MQILNYQLVESDSDEAPEFLYVPPNSSAPQKHPQNFVQQTSASTSVPTNLSSLKPTLKRPAVRSRGRPPKVKIDDQANAKSASISQSPKNPKKPRPRGRPRKTQQPKQISIKSDSSQKLKRRGRPPKKTINKQTQQHKFPTANETMLHIGRSPTIERFALIENEELYRNRFDILYPNVLQIHQNLLTCLSVHLQWEICVVAFVC